MNSGVRIGVAACVMVIAACGGGTAAGPSTTSTEGAVTTTLAVTTTSGATTSTGPAVSLTTSPPISGDADLEAGRVIWDEYYLGEGCQKCHGPDAKGLEDVPNIVGASRTKIVEALADVEEMQWEVKLTSAEIDAVYAYLQYLSQP